MRHWRRLAVTLAIGASVSPAFAQSKSLAANAVRPVRFEEPPVIDGHIDEAVWTSAARLDGFRQVQPGDNVEPSQQTEVLIGYDRRALYLAFRASDTSGNVRATVARRDSRRNSVASSSVIEHFIIARSSRPAEMNVF